MGAEMLQSRLKKIALLTAAIWFAPVQAVNFEYVLPRAGDVSLVIEDASGHRVRNLVSDASRAAGRVTDIFGALRVRQMRIQCGILLGGKQQGQQEKTT